MIMKFTDRKKYSENHISNLYKPNFSSITRKNDRLCGAAQKQTTFQLLLKTGRLEFKYKRSYLRKQNNLQTANLKKCFVLASFHQLYKVTDGNEKFHERGSATDNV